MGGRYPAAAKAICAVLTPMPPATLCRAVETAFLPMDIATAIPLRSGFSSTTCALSEAKAFTPKDTPQSAVTRAAASFTPSPQNITTSPSCCHLRIASLFWAGRHCANSVMPSSPATAGSLSLVSPLKMARRSPLLRSCATAPRALSRSWSPKWSVATLTPLMARPTATESRVEAWPSATPCSASRSEDPRTTWKVVPTRSTTPTTPLPGSCSACFSSHDALNSPLLAGKITRSTWCCVAVAKGCTHRHSNR
mmetsp:Transcript_12319/g.27292  ORF Transcript_12319/g.27292 Transcript_12319/m.27292 type:complete len:252 (-) Transcript_12319:643-1398(-)